MLTANLSARVTHVLPNGYLVIEGTKRVQVSSENQVITVRGVIRPVDLDPTNTIASNRIAQMEIQVNGKGVIGRFHSPAEYSVPHFLGITAVLSSKMMRLSLLIIDRRGCCCSFRLPAESPTARLKELVSLEGVRENQLIGYGIVVGLKGTGDRQQTLFTAQSLTNMLQQMGVTVNPTTILVKNTAAVMVTATLPPFAQSGMQIDATVAAMGDSASLQGGLLLMTSLRGIDGQVYSIAQGPVVTGGFIAGGAGNTQTVNHPTVGRIPSGAIVERQSPAVEPTKAGAPAAS